MNRDTLIEKYKIILDGLIKNNIIYKTGRKQKFYNDFYLSYIMRILFYGEKWETFDCKFCNGSTIRKRFVVWSNNNIFYDAYIKMYHNYTII